MASALSVIVRYVRLNRIAVPERLTAVNAADLLVDVRWSRRDVVLIYMAAKSTDLPLGPRTNRHLLRISMFLKHPCCAIT
jgi:hypothetical protein